MEDLLRWALGVVITAYGVALGALWRRFLDFVKESDMLKAQKLSEFDKLKSVVYGDEEIGNESILTMLKEARKERTELIERLARIETILLNGKGDDFHV